MWLPYANGYDYSVHLSDFNSAPICWDNEKEDWKWTMNRRSRFKPKKYGIRKLWIDMC